MAKTSTPAPSADYATISALLAADDTQSAELVVWGQRLKVRGLTLEERERVRSPSWKVEGTPGDTALVIGYLVHGVAEPRINVEQAKQLIGKNAGRVMQIYQLINNLTELDSADIVAQAERILALSRELRGDDDGSLADDSRASE